MKKQLLGTYYKLLGKLARIYLQKTKPYIVGINGSVGKTSCRMIIAQTLQQTLPKNYTIYTSPKNYNGELGMSFSIFGLEDYTPGVLGLVKAFWFCLKKAYFTATIQDTTSVLLLEYGIDHPGEMGFLLSIAKPHCAVHTQIDSVHSEQFGSPEAIAREEFLLEQNTLEIVFLNTDDPYAQGLEKTIPCDIITYSANNKSPETTISITPIDTPQNPYKTVQSATISFNNKKQLTVGISILGEFHMAYTGVGLCIADIISQKYEGKPIIQNEDTLHLQTALQPGRRTIFPGAYESIIIDSSYNASPRSVKEMIEEITQWRNNSHSRHKLLLVLGDMRELGSQEQHEHEQLAKFLQGYDASLILLGEAMHKYVLPYFTKYGSGRLQTVQHFFTYAEVGSYVQSFLLQRSQDNYIVLFKGSQNTIFLEEAVKYVLANKEDEQKLTRQSPRRAKKKKVFLDYKKGCKNSH